MLNINLWKLLTHTTTSVVLLTTVNLALPVVSLAQQEISSTSSLSTDYLLGGGDRIRVNVFEVPEYTGEYQVPPGGAINLPLVGSISVLGLTTEQASDRIARRYARFLKRPLISVNLLAPRPINIFVAGEVTSPGAYTLSLQGSGGDNPGLQYPTVLAALSTAKGVTLAADVTQVQLRRKVSGSGEQVVTLNLKEITQTGRIPIDITLRDGDTITVPTATALNVAEARNLFAANYAASQTEPRTVAVTGEVYRPGSYLVTPGSTALPAGAVNPETTGSGLPTVMRAIQLAGGITSQADVRNITVRRPTRTNTRQTITLNLWELLQSGDLDQDIILQEGDTIVVPTATEINTAEATKLATTTLSPATIKVGVVGEVKRPGLTELQPNSSLNQALLAAGGFNDARASSSAVDLIRLNSNGTVTKRVVKIDFSKGINEETNPILRNNDVVVVNRSGVAKTGDTLGTVSGPLGVIFSVLRFFGL
ncbi:MAG: polysaccharide export protein [Nostocales cyanobacterium]|nr:MAG: polysaccharide export protein [Nostocales cyanobacterium]TAF09644.1 MAG: polysaccharide export protein [Nostocales cyanobacterium]